MKILIVDDDRSIAEAITFGLELQWNDVQVISAADGEAGLDMFIKELPDLVLLDIMMPGMSGLEVLERWRANGATEKLPVIMLTAKAQENDVERGFELGADDYVIKPFSPRELARRVTAVLSRRQSA